MVLTVCRAHALQPYLNLEQLVDLRLMADVTTWPESNYLKVKFDFELHEEHSLEIVKVRDRIPTVARSFLPLFFSLYICD